jgi:hypothetical protein
MAHPRFSGVDWLVRGARARRQAATSLSRRVRQEGPATADRLFSGDGAGLPGEFPPPAGTRESAVVGYFLAGVWDTTVRSGAPMNETRLTRQPSEARIHSWRSRYRSFRCTIVPLAASRSWRSMA